MHSKHFCIGFLMLLGIASGVTACGGVGAEGTSEQWAGDDKSAPQPPADDVGPVIAPGPQKVLNCGIIACPDGTLCMLDGEGEARCGDPGAQSCDFVNCGEHSHCVMTDVGAVCMPGASDI